ncbi:nitrogen regulation protein NR(II) [Candidatus Omnitrophota bacterium]
MKQYKFLFGGLIAAYCIVLLLIFETKLLVSGSYEFFWGYYPKAGKWHFIYMALWLSLYLKTMYLTYIHGYRNIANLYTKEECNRIKYGFWILVFGCLGIIDFLAKYGFEVYPIGYIFIPIFAFITAYSIVKHHILDIEIVLKKGLVYSILVGIITIIYLLLVVLVEKLLQGMMGYQSIVISAAAALVIALLFIPLKNKIQNFVDRVFFKGTFSQIAQEKELMQQELERSERLKAVATLASGMAHEIKNPLTAIKTFSEYLPEKKDDAEFLNKFSKIVGSEVDRIDSLVHQLLDFAKPAPLKLQKININVLLDETLTILNNEFIKHKITVTKELTLTNNRKIQADLNQLKQAFLNLFLNAIDSMPKGGSLIVRTLRQTTTKQSIEIAISDTGCGISKKDLPRLFDPFFSTKENGAGLGLSITHEIIKNHGGKIRVESKNGKGSTFMVELPA